MAIWSSCSAPKRFRNHSADSASALPALAMRIFSAVEKTALAMRVQEGSGASPAPAASSTCHCYAYTRSDGQTRQRARLVPRSLRFLSASKLLGFSRPTLQSTANPAQRTVKQRFKLSQRHGTATMTSKLARNLATNKLPAATSGHDERSAYVLPT